MSLSNALHRQLAGVAPGLEASLTRAHWQWENRSRKYDPDGLAPGLRRLVDALREDGVVITDVETVFGDRSVFESAAERVERLRAGHRIEKGEAGTKSSFLAKLTTGPYDVEDPLARLALHPNALAVANGYLGIRSTVRDIATWKTWPTPEQEAVETQLWHRDGDDLINLKMFVYFTEVVREAGPLCYAPGTHPFGRHARTWAEHDGRRRSTDDQVNALVPAERWVYCLGSPGTVVFADTCGYHKQVKPESKERVLAMTHYVSGTPYVSRTLEIRGVDADVLTDDQYVAVFDRLRTR